MKRFSEGAGENFSFGRALAQRTFAHEAAYL